MRIIKNCLIALLVLACGIMKAQKELLDTTVTSNGKTIHIKQIYISEDYYEVVILPEIQLEYDTIKGSRQYDSLTYRDFDGDGYNDIIMNFEGDYGFSPGNILQDYFLYHPAARKYKRMGYYGQYSNAKPLKTNPKVFYSFWPNGCDDSDWYSRLFIIEKDYTITQLGYMQVFGCEVAPKEILIYRTAKSDRHPNAGKKDIVMASPYKLFDNPDYNKSIPTIKFVDRDAFIEKYWSESWSKFIVEEKPEETEKKD